MEEQPRGWRYDEVASLLRAFGFTEHRGGGSHRQWTHPRSLPITVVDTGHGTVPAYQVDQATAAVRNTQEER